MNIFGDKSWYESMTAWGMVIYGAAGGAEQAGLAPPGLAEGFLDIMQAAGGMLTVLGIRRAATAKNVS